MSERIQPGSNDLENQNKQSVKQKDVGDLLAEIKAKVVSERTALGMFMFVAGAYIGRGNGTVESLLPTLVVEVSLGSNCFIKMYQGFQLNTQLKREYLKRSK